MILIFWNDSYVANVETKMETIEDERTIRESEYIMETGIP